MGFALTFLSSLATHSSLPVFESNARKRWSVVAPMKTSPPAVTIGPALPASVRAVGVVTPASQTPPPVGVSLMPPTGSIPARFHIRMVGAE